MTFAPFLAAPLVVQVHIVAAMLVLCSTPFQFWFTQRGSLPHRVLGYLWLLGMFIVAVSSFWISSNFRLSLYGFSLIHLLSMLTLVSIGLIILRARQGRIAAHRRFVLGLTIGFLSAGAFTLPASRIMGRMFFGF